MAKIIEVIEAEVTRGSGNLSDDPYRTVTQYWSKEGELLWEKDAWKEKRKEKQEEKPQVKEQKADSYWSNLENSYKRPNTYNT